MVGERLQYLQEVAIKYNSKQYKDFNGILWGVEQNREQTGTTRETTNDYLGWQTWAD